MHALQRVALYKVQLTRAVWRSRSPCPVDDTNGRREVLGPVLVCPLCATHDATGGAGSAGRIVFLQAPDLEQPDARVDHRVRARAGHHDSTPASQLRGAANRRGGLQQQERRPKEEARYTWRQRPPKGERVVVLAGGSCRPGSRWASAENATVYLPTSRPAVKWQTLCPRCLRAQRAAQGAGRDAGEARPARGWDGLVRVLKPK